MQIKAIYPGQTAHIVAVVLGVTGYVAQPLDSTCTGHFTQAAR